MVCALQQAACNIARTIYLTFAPSLSICLLPNTHIGPVAAGHEQSKWFPEEDRQRVSVDGKNNKEITFERYEPRKQDKMQAISLSFDVIQPRSGEEQRLYPLYDMSSSPHGIALIINIEQILGQNNRQGTRIDEKNLIQTFRYLGYIVEVHRDCSASQIRDIFDEVSTRDHSKYDSFVSCLLSHGAEGEIYGSDGAKVDITELVIKFNAESCKLLGNKPKMFFVQACRGREKDKGTMVCADSVEEDSILVPDEEDVYIGYATPPGKVAWRDTQHGSWYISELCRALCTHATHAHLLCMVQEVNEKVGVNYSTRSGNKQAPEYVTQLRKDVYFF